MSAHLASLETVQQPAGLVLRRFLEVRGMGKDESDGDKAKRREVLTAITQQTAEARIARAVDSPNQLEEVMVDFWFNHFNVFFRQGRRPGADRQLRA